MQLDKENDIVDPARMKRLALAGIGSTLVLVAGCGGTTSDAPPVAVE